MLNMKELNWPTLPKICILYHSGMINGQKLNTMTFAVNQLTANILNIMKKKWALIILL